MRRTTIVLPENILKKLKHMAVESDTSLAHLIREALETVYQENLEDLQRAEKLLAKHKPGTGLPYASYRARRLH